MTKRLLKLGGYFAEITLDDSANMFHGRLVGIKDVVDFYAEDYKGLMQEFRTSVEEYEAMCREGGVQPERPWKGRTTLRPSDEQKKRYAIAAAVANKSINAWMLDTLDRESERVTERAAVVVG